MPINLSVPPIQEPVTDNKGLMGIIWNSFFQKLYRLLSQPSYGSKPCTFTISGITGAYSTSYKWISDRDFVHFYLTLVPTSTVALSGATVLPVLDNSSKFDDSPLGISKVMVSLYSGTTRKDSRPVLIDTTGLIHIDDILSTGYTILISGSFIKNF